MARNSLRHEVSWATAERILEFVARSLRDEDRRDAFVEIYSRVSAGLEAFEIQTQRFERAMQPSKN